MYGALRRTGRTGRVEPKAYSVASGIGYLETGARAGDELGHTQGMRGFAAADDDLTQRRYSVEQRAKLRQQSCGNEGQPGITVAQNVFVVGGGQQGVDRDGNDSCLDGAQKRDGKIDAIVQAQQDALSCGKSRGT